MSSPDQRAAAADGDAARRAAAGEAAPPANGGGELAPASVARRPRALDVAAVALFLAAVAAPAIGALLRPGAAARSVEDEQRRPASSPWSWPRSLRDAARWPRAIKSWHDDHLGLRDVVLEARSRLLFHGLGISPTRSAVVGPDGWLWYAGESSIPAWRGSAPLSPAAITDWVRVFRDRHAWCAARGIAYCASLVPNKYEVYPERVPAPYVQIGPSRYEQINAALAAEPGDWYLDMRAVLRDERKNDTPDDVVYSRRGTHWTGRGGLRAVTELMSRARALGVDVEIPGPSSFEFQPLGFDDDAWTRQLHLPDLPEEKQPVLVRNLSRKWRPTEMVDTRQNRVETLSGDESLPRLWVVHDSFGVLLRLMLPPFFDRTSADWNGLGDFDPASMIAFAPDLVFDVHTERQIYAPPPDFIASIDRVERRRRFDRGEPVWSLAHSVDRVRPDDGVELAVEGGEIVLTTEREGSGVVLGDVDVGVAATPILQLELESGDEGTIYVQWQLRGAKGWHNAQSAHRPLYAGAQTLQLEILDPDARGPIRLRVDRDAGRVRLRTAELRSASW